MKKTKLLALTLVVAIMMIGAGYAYWTDQLVINNNVTTGEMNVEFIDPHFSESELSSRNDYIILHEVARDAKTVQFKLENLYPGVQYDTLTEMQNKGTIPAVFDNAVVTFEGDPDDILKNNLNVYFDCWIYDENGTHIHTIFGSSTTVANLESALNNALAGLRLEPGQYLTFQGESVDQLMRYELNPALEEGELTNLIFDITINWKQHNAQ